MEAPVTEALGLNTLPEPCDRDSQVRGIYAPATAPTAMQPPPPKVPATLPERLALARERLHHAALNGLRIRVYEVALDLDMSEFHFARQFRAAYGRSPHVFYDEVRAAKARDLLTEGMTQGQAARRIGLRRPAELRALLGKRTEYRGCCPETGEPLPQLRATEPPDETADPGAC